MKILQVIHALCPKHWPEPSSTLMNYRSIWLCEAIGQSVLSRVESPSVLDSSENSGHQVVETIEHLRLR